MVRGPFRRVRETRRERSGKVLLALDHGSIRHPYYRSYLGRNYFSRRRGYRAVPIASSSVAIPLPNCHESAQTDTRRRGTATSMKR